MARSETSIWFNCPTGTMRLKLPTSVDRTFVLDILKCTDQGNFWALSVGLLQNCATYLQWYVQLFYWGTKKKLQRQKKQSIRTIWETNKVHMLTKTMSRMLIQYKALPISLRSWRTSVLTSDFASHVNISWTIFWQPTIKEGFHCS